MPLQFLILYGRISLCTYARHQLKKRVPSRETIRWGCASAAKTVCRTSAFLIYINAYALQLHIAVVFEIAELKTFPSLGLVCVLFSARREMICLLPIWRCYIAMTHANHASHADCSGAPLREGKTRCGVAQNLQTCVSHGTCVSVCYHELWTACRR
jgi:hypothetical protein